MKRFMQKLEKSNGKYSNAQSLHQKYLKIARYSCAIFNTNLAHCCISEPNILNRTQVINLSFQFSHHESDDTACWQTQNRSASCYRFAEFHVWFLPSTFHRH